MKYVILLGDGMADEPLKSLGGKTPLEAANTPNLDAIAAKGETGLVQTIPPGFPPGSDVANLAVLGYDPREYYTGRAPLEAVSMGVELGEKDLAYRCNLVTLSGEEDYPAKTMLDYSAGEIATGEAKELILAVEARLGGSGRHFYPGISYRHLLVWHGGPEQSQLTPPHDISCRPVTEHLPRGEGAATLLELMKESNLFLPKHPLNLTKAAKNLPQANSIWLWGQGKKPALPSFKAKYQLEGAVISAVDLVKGLGLCAGLTPVQVAGATGNIHTNFTGKGEAAIRELDRGRDFVYIHVEAPDEAGHQGDLATKIKAIEAVDQMLGLLLQELRRFPRYKIMVLPDHPTPLRLRTHTGKPVPYVIYPSGEQSGGKVYSEAAAAGGNFQETGHLLMDRFIRG